MKLIENADLSAFNTLRVPARSLGLAKVEHWYELEQVMEDRRFRDMPKLALGEGSNVLFRHDFPGLVIRVANYGVQILETDERSVYVRLAAGENWHEFVEWAAGRRLWGTENLALIPGTVGAAPVQNIGAYGVELSEFLVFLRAFDPVRGQWHDFTPEECGFGYRQSIFKGDEAERYIITEVVLRLARKGEARLEYPGLADKVRELGPEAVNDPAMIAAAVSSIRRSKLPEPAEIPNVGSFFKNPIVKPGQADAVREAAPDAPVFPAEGGIKLSAAWLIEACGFKGYRSGDAGVYEGHALVLVNHGDATGADLWRLAREIQDAVFERFGIHLEPEPLIV